MALSDTMQQALEPYFDLDFLDPLSAPRKKKDGNYYTTYIAELQPSQMTLVPDSGSVILKEISPAQADIYEKISSIWNPYIETVFGVIYQNGQNLAVNEFIPKPSALTYPDSLLDKRSLSLEDYIREYGCLSEKEALIFLLQLCKGLEGLSSLSLVHGDVAPQNILLTDPTALIPGTCQNVSGIHQKISCKLIDFDIAGKFKNQNHLVTVIAGTNPYAAPEILDYKNPTDRIDIYSLGCVLAFMLTGKSPKQISSQELNARCSKKVRKLIAKCTADYSKRFRNCRALRRHIMNILYVTAPPYDSLFNHIPGFRGRHPVIMAVLLLLLVLLFLT